MNVKSDLGLEGRRQGIKESGVEGCCLSGRLSGARGNGKGEPFQ